MSDPVLACSGTRGSMATAFTELHRTCRLALEVQCSPKEAQQRKWQHGCCLQKEASSPAEGPCYCAPQDVACRSVLASMGVQPLAEV